MLKIFIKKIAKIFGRLKKVSYFCTRRDGRVVDCGGLENRCAARHRGFESLSLRQADNRQATDENQSLFLFLGFPQIHLPGEAFL